MGCVKAECVSPSPGTSSINLAMTIREQSYVYHGTLVPSKNFRQWIFSIYIHDIDLAVEGDVRSAQKSSQNSTQLQPLTEMLHETNRYVPSFAALRKCVSLVDAPNLYCMVIDGYRRPTGEHVCRNIGLQTFGIATISLGAKDGIFGHQDVVIQQSGMVNDNRSEQFDTVPALTGLMTH